MAISKSSIEDAGGCSGAGGSSLEIFLSPLPPDAEEEEKTSQQAAAVPSRRSSERSLSPLPTKNGEGKGEEGKCEEGRAQEDDDGSIGRGEQEADLKKVQEWVTQQIECVFSRTKVMINKEFVDSRVQLFEKIEFNFIQTITRDLMNLLPPDLLSSMQENNVPQEGAVWDSEIGRLARALRDSAQIFLQSRGLGDTLPPQKKRKTEMAIESNPSVGMKHSDGEASPVKDNDGALGDENQTPSPSSVAASSDSSALSMRQSLTDTALREQLRKQESATRARAKKGW